MKHVTMAEGPLTRSRAALAAVAVACTMACAASEDDLDTSSEPAGDEAAEIVASKELALDGGHFVPDENYSGIVALQVYSETVNGQLTFCSGVLMTNSVVITARHCLGSAGDRPINVKMGNQNAGVWASYPHEGMDVAILKLSLPFEMWNWTYDHWTGPAWSRGYVDYRRDLYRGTDASLNGKTLTCFGYGGGTISNPRPRLEVGEMKANYPSGGKQHGVELVGMSYNIMKSEDGDSGGPCLETASMAGGKLATIFVTGCWYTCGSLGAPDFVYWADLVTYSLHVTYPW